jgi:hypothetical protein
MDPPEQHRAQVDPEPAQPAVEPPHGSKHSARDGIAAPDFVRHALVNQVEELRHAGEQRHAALAERAEQFRRVHRFQEHDARANRQRQQQVGHLRQGVEQGQHAEDAVLLGDRDRFEHRRPFGDQVRVRQDDALWVARRP